VEWKGLVGGRHFELGKPAALVRGRWKEFWLFSVNPALSGERRGATGSVRGHVLSARKTI